MGHCSGGQATDTFDMLSAVVDWVEKGTAPDSVDRHRQSVSGPQSPAVRVSELRAIHRLGRRRGREKLRLPPVGPRVIDAGPRRR